MLIDSLVCSVLIDENDSEIRGKRLHLVEIDVMG